MEGGASYHIPGQDDIEGAGAIGLAPAEAQVLVAVSPKHNTSSATRSSSPAARKEHLDATTKANPGMDSVDRGDCLVGRFTKDGGDI